MAANVTLLQMRTDARERADMATGGAGAFATDTLVTRWVNQAMKRLYGKLVAARGGDYYSARSTITTVVDTELYNLPSDFMSLQALLLEYNGEYHDLGRYELREEHVLRGQWAVTDPRALHFRLFNAQVRLLPVPKQVLTITCIYIPVAPELSLDADTYDGINGFEDWITISVAIKLRQKAKHGSEDLMTERNLIDKEIAALSSHRDGQPAKIIDTRRDHAYHIPYWSHRYD